MKKIYRSAILFSGIFALGGTLLASQAHAYSFHITITNLSPNVLSPTALVSHNSGFDLFDTGSAASAAVELLAETGNPSGVTTLASAAVGTTVLDYQVASGGILAQGFSGEAYLEADSAHPWLSFMSMMGISNDGFIGGTTGDGAISLFSGGSPVFGTYIIAPEYVWDAGTEINDEAFGSVGALGGGNGGFDENGVVTINHPGILGVGGSTGIPLSRNWTGGDVARITIAPVPEPSAMMLFGTGITALIGSLARRKKK